MGETTPTDAVGEAAIRRGGHTAGLRRGGGHGLGGGGPMGRRQADGAAAGRWTDRSAYPPLVTSDRAPGPPDAERRLPLPEPYSLRLTLGIHARGRADPSMRFEASGSTWRATRTPAGPVTLFIEARGGWARARAWGPGSGWALDGLEGLLGLDDDPDALVPQHPAVAAAVKRSPGLRFGRTLAVLEALVPAILGQKITADEARRTLGGLVRVYGEDAPGPPGLRLLPEPHVLARLPYHAFHPLGLERRRAELVKAVCRDAARLERLGEDAGGPDSAPETLAAREAAYAALRAYPGIGPWTAAQVGMRAFGDPDAVSVGDFHLPTWSRGRWPASRGAPTSGCWSSWSRTGASAGG